MDVTTRAALISTGGVVIAGILAWFGSRRIPKAQRNNLMVDTAERVVALQERERQQLAQRITDLETEVAALKATAAERERQLEHSRGENAKLSAEVGTLRATLAAKEAELAALKAQQASSTATVTVNTAPVSTEGQ